MRAFQLLSILILTVFVQLGRADVVVQGIDGLDQNKKLVGFGIIKDGLSISFLGGEFIIIPTNLLGEVGLNSAELHGLLREYLANKSWNIYLNLSGSLNSRATSIGPIVIWERSVHY